MWPFRKKTSSGPGEKPLHAEIFSRARALLGDARKARLPAADPSGGSKRRATAAREKMLEERVEKRTEELEKEVQELYTEPDGTIPDLTVLEHARTHRIRNSLIGLTVFFGLLAGAAWTGFFIFTPYERFAQGDLTLSVDVPETVRSGEEATVTIRYAAKPGVALGSMEISIRLPDGFTLVSAEPAATDGTRWVLGAVPVGGSGTIVIHGIVRGAAGTLLTMQSFASYVPATFNSEFQSVASSAFTIAGSTLGLAATSTERALPGEPITATFTVRNDGTTPADDVAFRATFPVGFLFASSTPSPSELPSSWKFGTLQPGAESTVAIRGTFSSTAKGSLVFAGELGLRKDGGFALQAASSTSVAVIGGDLAVTAIVNGAVDGAPVDFGDTLRATVSYANKSEATLDDVALVLKLEGTPTGTKLLFDPASIADSPHGSFATSSGTITWTKKEVQKLGRLAPGDEGTIDVSFRLVGSPFAPGAKDYALALSVEGTVGKVNGVTKNRRVLSSRFLFPFLSDLRFRPEARYYNDDEIPVGTGPLPPKIGQETTYRIFWDIENALHDLTDMTARTTLPDNVRFTGKTDVSAGEVTYDDATRTVTWTLNRLPVGAPSVHVDFEVGLTPGSAALGNILPLTGIASVDAEDAAVSGRIHRSVDAADTAIVSDPLGKGKGVVTN